jgi:ATP-binding cassette, subfamily B, bacterial
MADSPAPAPADLAGASAPVPAASGLPAAGGAPAAGGPPAAGGAPAAGEYGSDQDRFRSPALQQRSLVRELGSVVETSWLARPGRLRVRAPAWPARRPRVPVHIQSQATDCGPACLAMVLGFHGIQVSVDELRRETNAGRDGVSARGLLEAGRRYGLSGRGVRVPLSKLRELPAGTILFWKFRHFVVLERATRDHLYIVDPALGRRRVSAAAADGAFTGVALEFQRPQSAPPPRARSLRGRLAASSWRYLGRFFPKNRAWIPLSAASLVLLLFNFATPFASAYLVDRQASGHAGYDLPVLLSAVAALVVAYCLLQVARGLAITSLQTVADKNVTLGVLHHLLSLPYDFFVRRNAGDLAMRVRTSLAVRRVLTSSALSTVFDGLLILIYSALLLLANAQLALLVMVLALLQVGVLLLFWPRQHYLMADALEAQAQAEGELIEVLDGVTTLKAAGLDGAAGEHWSHTFADEVNTRRRGSRSLAVCGGLIGGLQFTAPLAVLTLGALQLSEHHSSLGEVIAFSSLAMGLFVPLTSLMQTGMQIAGLGRTLSRLADIMETAPEDRALGSAPARDVRGQVEARNVQFTYPGSEAPVLSDVSLYAPPGSFIALLGQSGCGKSTLAAILAGLYLPASGTVLIDGTATGEIDRAALRRRIGYVNQDARLFAGSIHENISMGHEGAHHSDIVAAARLAQIHDDICALPMKYLTLLGPGGAGLSGGQRQRIALARALVRRPPLMILDEATSALDRDTEKRIFADLLKLDCTLVVIAHRLPAVQAAAEIVVMSAGRVVQRGSHHELMAMAGPYRALAASAP